MEKKERGSNIIFPITFRLLGRISSEEEGGNFGGENQDLVGKIFDMCGTLRHP